MYSCLHWLSCLRWHSIPPQCLALQWTSSPWMYNIDCFNCDSYSVISWLLKCLNAPLIVYLIIGWEALWRHRSFRWDWIFTQFYNSVKWFQFKSNDIISFSGYFDPFGLSEGKSKQEVKVISPNYSLYYPIALLAVE